MKKCIQSILTKSKSVTAKVYRGSLMTLALGFMAVAFAPLLTASPILGASPVYAATDVFGGSSTVAPSGTETAVKNLINWGLNILYIVAIAFILYKNVKEIMTGADGSAMDNVKDIAIDIVVLTLIMKVGIPWLTGFGTTLGQDFTNISGVATTTVGQG